MGLMLRMVGFKETAAFIINTFIAENSVWEITGVVEILCTA